MKSRFVSLLSSLMLLTGINTNMFSEENKASTAKKQAKKAKSKRIAAAEKKIKEVKKTVVWNRDEGF